MNTLYPIFLKLSELPVLIVGAGEVGLEKLSFMLKNSPDAKITLIAKEIFQPEVLEVAAEFQNVEVQNKAFVPSDLDGKRFVILATNDVQLDKDIKAMCTERNILCNVADVPAMCDFYLGSIVSRGDLKIAISTNGKSPTIAKRLRAYLEDALPENTTQLLDNLSELRDRLTGDLKNKITELNRLTSGLVSKSKKDP